ncbi:MAG TPA: hypothetical protein VKA36_04640 [Solirubrobacterales bacterium]|nr:hypothetical protein [Solirubrobacterales bacterium]
MADPEEPEDPPYPCPACGARLFGWTAARHPIDGSKIVLDRCEDDGLVVTRAPEPPDLGIELAEFAATGGRIEAPNRESFQGGIGGAQWAGLEPDRRRLHLSPRAAKLLLRTRGIEVLESSTPPSFRSYAAMLQTMVNAFTLHDNFFRNARAGRLPRRTLKQRLGFALDAIVTVLVAIPLSIVALPTELLGSLVGRGGRMVLETAVDPGPRETGPG